MYLSVPLLIFLLATTTIIGFSFASLKAKNSADRQFHSFNHLLELIPPLFRNIAKEDWYRAIGQLETIIDEVHQSQGLLWPNSSFLETGQRSDLSVLLEFLIREFLIRSVSPGDREEVREIARRLNAEGRLRTSAATKAALGLTP